MSNSRINIKEIVSFSSEDPANPASNLLEAANFRKWRCKDEGELEACVIFQLEKAVSITGIDIGNECSAMVEVLVSRSGDSTKTFEVLLPCATFMSPIESREVRNHNRVRMFRKEKLDKATLSQKWDIVKVVCTQRHNKHTQYGLCFITFFTDSDNNEKPKIGGFGMSHLKNEDEDEPVRIGSMFAKRMEVLSKKEDSTKPDKTMSTAAVLRNGGSSLAAAAISNSKERVRDLLSMDKSNVPPDFVGQKQSDIIVPTSSRSNSSSSISSEEEESKTNEPNSSKLLTGQSNSNSTPKATSAKTQASKPNAGSSDANRSRRKTKPFNKLFEDVVFVMSGYENPYRSDLRNKALEMGAKCKQDWTSICTHLICAFVNTPKFRQVRATGRGKIVSNRWIEASHRKRRRLPWRRYYVDKSDKGAVSEDEVFADDCEEEDDDVGSSRNNGPDVSRSSSRSTKYGPVGNRDEVISPKKRKRVLEFDDESDDDKEETVIMVDPYNVDTDVDENEASYPSSSIEMQRDCFADFSFCFDGSWAERKEKEAVCRIIEHRKGIIVPKLAGNVEYLITQQKEWTEEFSEALSEDPNLTIVTGEWIIECEKKNEMVPLDSYVILPN